MTSIQADLRNYDLFPRVVIEGDPVTVTIRPLGQHAAFDPEAEYRVLVLPRNDRDYKSVTETRAPRVTELFKKPDADGCIRVPFTFRGEQVWFFRLFQPGERDLVDRRDDIAARPGTREEGVLRVLRIVRRSTIGTPLDGTDLHAVFVERVRFNAEIRVLHVEVRRVRMTARGMETAPFVVAAIDVPQSRF